MYIAGKCNTSDLAGLIKMWIQGMNNPGLSVSVKVGIFVLMTVGNETLFLPPMLL
jgi:hypothetical protein